MMTRQATWAARAATTTLLALAAVAPAAEASASPGTGDQNQNPPVTSSVTVGYGCFVTFPGGETTVPYSLTFATMAPAEVSPWKKFRVVLDPPVITPNPAIQTEVRDVAVQYRLPDDSWLVGYRLVGGDLNGHSATVQRDGDVLEVKAHGPFPAAQPFELPELRLTLRAHHGGVLQTTTGGTSTDDPSFSWTRTSASTGDPAGTLRPFRCEPATPVVFTSTTVHP
jgi:dehydratase